MEYKNFAPQNVKSGSAGSAQFVIATIGRRDADSDIVESGAIGRQTVVVLPAHDWTSVPLGKAETHEDGHHVLADVRFNLDVPEARSWHAALKFDMEHGPPVQEFSWGYDPVLSKPDRVDGVLVRRLQKIKLHEVSMVVRGSSVGSRLVTVKERDDDGRDLTPEQRAELLRIRSDSEAWRLKKEGLHAMARIELERSRQMLEEADKPDGATMAFARSCAELAAEKLRLKSAPPIKWFAPGRYPASLDPHVQPAGEAMRSGSITGWANRVSNEIWIANTLKGLELAKTVVHECSHLGGREHPESQHFAERHADEIFSEAHRALR